MSASYPHIYYPDPFSVILPIPIMKEPIPSHTHGQRKLTCHAEYLNLRQKVKDRMDRAIREAWRPSTLGKYSNGIHRFLTFCNTENIPNSFCLPASEYLLCAFAASTIGERSGETISADISTLCAWHILNNTPWMGRMRLCYTIKGAKNLTPESSKLPRRPVNIRSPESTVHLLMR